MIEDLDSIQYVKTKTHTACVQCPVPLNTDTRSHPNVSSATKHWMQALLNKI